MCIGAVKTFLNQLVRNKQKLAYLIGLQQRAKPFCHDFQGL